MGFLDSEGGSQAGGGGKRPKGKAKAKAKAQAQSKGQRGCQAGPGATLSGGPSKVLAAAETLLRGSAIKETDLSGVIQHWNKQLSLDVSKCVATVRAVQVAKVPRLALEGRLRRRPESCAGDVHGPSVPCW